MMKKKRVCLLAILLCCSASALADGSVTGVINGVRMELTWPSEVNHDYSIMLSTNLIEGYSEFATVQSTPPLNIWWEDLAHDARFYAVSRPAPTNSPGDTRAFAREVNRRMGRGNNFMAAKSMNAQGGLEDYILLNNSHFAHCRIGYKMDEVCGSAPGYLIPAHEMANLQTMVDWCLSQGLMPNIDPVHNWANGPGFTYPTDLPKLSNIWVQVAAHFADFDIENVVFEIMNEPHAGSEVAEIMATGLAAIRGIPGNEQRIVIVEGDGFSTRQALIDAFNNDEIPANDPYLIGSFHYYDPRTFTAQGAGGINWGSAAEFAETITKFDEVLTANTNWAVRNATDPLPLYLGEFGVDNGAPSSDRKKWISWIRMQAEARGISWAHWNMYSNVDNNKGMGPWTNTEKNNPDQRYFDADPLEALIGRYEVEEGTTGGGVADATTYAGYTGSGYSAFPAETGLGVWAQVNDIYIPKTDTFIVQIHYASDTARTLRLVSRNDSGTTVQTIPEQVFPVTGGPNSWQTLEVPLNFEAGDLASLRIVADLDEGVNLDWINITR